MSVNPSVLVGADVDSRVGLRAVAGNNSVGSDTPSVLVEQDVTSVLDELERSGTRRG